MNEIAAFFGNYPLLNIFVITSINIITKHYYQLMPFSLSTYFWIESQFTATCIKCTVQGKGYALGYASGKVLKISNF
ncbi:hypothetical protein T07_8718 [Trichinella nelsoni]|uniref:Uncharacterized protein n=1 Tax=Trichinella nelsoni TaxID=6336 RepID=A0A0V0RK53_9BILA|nr:hypothetical protein T07_8718 [Trichinella nelsoni]